MKRLSFLWLLLLATYSVSFANTYSDDNNTDLWGDWEESGSILHQYWHVFYKDSIYYGFYPEGSNHEETASVAFYFVGDYGSTPTVYPKSKKLSKDMRTGREYMPQGETRIKRRLYTMQNVSISSSIIVENKTIPVTRIHDCAFAESPNLTSISLPSSITLIGEAAFRNCKKLSSIVIPNSVERIKKSAFAGCIGLQSVTLGNNVKYIGEMAFQQCTSLASITIPNSVDSIEESAFADCIGLQSVTIGSGVEYIGAYAFSGTGLTSITIPDNVNKIESSTFYNCKNLTSVTCTSTTPPVIYSSAFYGCDNLKVIYIPCGTKEAYKAAGWGFLPLTEPAPDGVVSVETVDNIKGQVKIEDQSTCRNNSTAIISATAQYGYHFTKWNDGNTDNPRTVQVTEDITYTAEFAYNQYTISTEVNDAERGSVSGGTTADYLSEVTLTATANYGYHFAHWTDRKGYREDWNTDNPRTVQVKGDATYSAVFEKNTYTITAQSANGIQGYVDAPSQAEYLDQVSLTANPNVGYHFTQWSDGNTDNPREIVLTYDTTFTAEFAQTFSGRCGYDLYWKYEGHTLTISGTGNMFYYYDYNMPWLLFRDTTDVVILERGITGIGNNAFNGFVKLGKIELPNTLTSIGANAFAGCRKLYDIYSYAVEPPAAENTSFANYNVYLHVPCDNLRDYQMDAVFGSFKYIQCIGAENTNTNDSITITPSTNDAVFVWRADEAAATYNLEIRKDGQVFCTLIFNAQGQLTSIAFAPARNGRPAARAAEQTAAGFRFTVTGLSQKTHYAFEMKVKDKADQLLQTYTGEFDTKADTPSAADNVSSEQESVRKVVRDGQVLIIRGGKTYTATGIEVQ